VPRLRGRTHHALVGLVREPLLARLRGLRLAGCGAAAVTPEQWEAWKQSFVPNGYCICQPKLGIVCGQHTGWHPLRAAMDAALHRQQPATVPDLLKRLRGHRFGPVP